MSAQQANVNIGGGEGLSAEGDLRINDESGNTRIQMTGADDGNRPSGQDRVWINGGSGEMELGSSGSNGSIALKDDNDNPAVELAVSSDDITEYQRATPRSRVEIVGGEPSVVVHDRPGGPGGVGPTSAMYADLLSLSGGTQRGRNTTLDSEKLEMSVSEAYGGVHTRITDATARLGGGDRKGLLKLQNSGGTNTVQLNSDGGLSLGSYDSGGRILFKDNSTDRNDDGNIVSSNKYKFIVETAGDVLEIGKAGPGSSNFKTMLEIDAAAETVKVRSGSGLKTL